MMRRLFQYGFLLLVLLQLASLAGTHFWLSDVLSEFAFQFLIGFTISVIAFFFLQSRRWATAAFIGLLWNLFALAPLYYPAAKSCQNCGGTTLSVVQFNAFFKNASVPNFVQWANAQTNIDVVVIAEAYSNDTALKQLKKTYPYSPPLTPWGDVSLYSKLPLSDVKWLPVLPDTTEDNDALSVMVTPPKSPHPVQIIALHPAFSLKYHLWQKRNRYLTHAAEMAAAMPDMPRIMVGDFNTTPWHPIMRDVQKISGLVDAQAGRGLMFTWHPLHRRSVITGLPIDQMLLSPDIVVTRRAIVSGDFGSDHVPVLTQLQIPHVTVRSPAPVPIPPSASTAPAATH